MERKVEIIKPIYHCNLLPFHFAHCTFLTSLENGIARFIVHTKEQASKHRRFEGHTSDPESSPISASASNKCTMIAVNAAF